MRINFSKNSLKFLDKINPKDKEKIRLRINEFAINLRSSEMIPYKEFQIKRLHGDWKGFMRMRIGKIRIIFELSKNKTELNIYEIDFRGNIYK